MDTHLIPFAQLCGFPPSVTSAAVSILAGFNIVGIIISGVIPDYWSSRKILFILYVVRALSIIILLNSYNPILLLIFAMFLGWLILQLLLLHSYLQNNILNSTLLALSLAVYFLVIKLDQHSEPMYRVYYTATMGLSLILLFFNYHFSYISNPYPSTS